MNQHNKQAPRVALVTGAAKRIGATIAKQLHQVGFRVVVHYHQSFDSAKDLVAQMNHHQPNSAHLLKADLSKEKEINKLIQETLRWAGRLDILVNNASVFLKSDNKSFMKSQWDALFDINVKAPFLLSHASYSHLAKQNGVIVNLTDIHADKPLKDYAAYCQSKAALAMQTKALAREFAPYVRVNAVAPGAIAWPEGDNVLSETLKQKIIEKTPLKQHGSPEFIAQAVLSLIANPFITGESLRVDGGRNLT